MFYKEAAHFLLDRKGQFVYVWECRMLFIYLSCVSPSTNNMLRERMMDGAVISFYARYGYDRGRRYDVSA
jgi:hypothetical protein